MNDPVKVRDARKEDMPAVFELIRDLAAYEKMPDEVEVTVAELERDGFGTDPVFYCFVAEAGDEIIGFALYYIKYSTWKGKCIFLEDFIVREPLRRTGVGKLLFEAVMKEAKRLKVKRMEWQVLKWNELALGFYRKYQAHLDGEWYNGKLVFEQLQNFNHEGL